jgi:hypothetical protein
MKSFIVVFVDAGDVRFHEVFGRDFSGIEEGDEIGYCRC